MFTVSVVTPARSGRPVAARNWAAVIRKFAERDAPLVATSAPGCTFGCERKIALTSTSTFGIVYDTEPAQRRLPRFGGAAGRLAVDHAPTAATVAGTRRHRPTEPAREHGAGVVDAVAGAGAALERQAFAAARAQRHVDAVPVVASPRRSRCPRCSTDRSRQAPSGCCARESSPGSRRRRGAADRSAP